jgi:hypothetical protein
MSFNAETIPTSGEMTTMLADPSEITKRSPAYGPHVLKSLGSTVDPDWVTIPDGAEFRGDLLMDTGGKFGGDLIGVTETGQVYLIDSNADYAELVNLNSSSIVEGAVVLP